MSDKKQFVKHLYQSGLHFLKYLESRASDEERQKALNDYTSFATSMDILVTTFYHSKDPAQRKLILDKYKTQLDNTDTWYDESEGGAESVSNFFDYSGDLDPKA